MGEYLNINKPGTDSKNVLLREKKQKANSPISNIAMLDMLGVNTPTSKERMDDLKAAISALSISRKQNQIPAAEQEADQIASSVSGARTPEEVKFALGEKMGADFSSVRFHTDSTAADKAGSIGARAYTTGHDVYFAEGGFDPSVAAHELVHTVQQGAVDISLPTVSVPMGSVQMMWPWSKKNTNFQQQTNLSAHQLDVSKYKFGKRAYAEDRSYQKLNELVKAYNKSNSAADEMALMNAAMDYINENSTGEKTKYKGRTANAEDIIYQLSMKGGKSQTADANINRLLNIVDTQDGIAENQKSSYIKKGKKTLNTLKGVYKPKSRYSKAMQAITASVAADQTSTIGYSVGDKSDAKRIIGSDNAGGVTKSYIVRNRVNSDLNDAIGTGLHEFTHVSSGKTYDNTSNFFTLPMDATPDEIKKERDERVDRMEGIKKAIPTAKSQKKAKSLESQMGYAISESYEKTYNKYIPDTKVNHLREIYTAKNINTDHLKNDFDWKNAVKNNYAKQIGDLPNVTNMTPKTKERIISESQSLNKIEKVFTSELQKGILPHSDSLVEYDSVINQMLLQYEHASKDRSSEYYRKLKAAALSSHVKRHNQKLLNQAK
ncbi:MAG: DUF4157 domain-containing protein [Desulfosporosinus sp.]|jgi:hypothetical protein